MPTCPPNKRHLPEIENRAAYDLIELKRDIISILGSDAILAEIASKSYIHKNGFMKIVYETCEETICRLHIYPPGASADKNIHDHRWDFDSITICGTLPMSCYYIDEGSSEILHLYSKTPGGGHLIESQFKCSAEFIDTIYVGKLQGYKMPYDLFHRIEAVDELTITYVETYPAISASCHLVSSEDRSGVGSVQPEPLTITDTRQALALIVNKLEELE